MTVREAAQSLEVTPDLIYRLCKRGVIPHLRIGTGRGVIRIRPEDLASYVESCRVVSKEPEPESVPAVRPRVAPRPKLKHFQNRNR